MGLTRTPGTNWDFDATATTIFGTHDSWTNKFELYKFDSTDKIYKGKSYGNLNAAYLGFEYEYDQIIINGGSRITVFAGSYTTDIAITVSGSGQMSSEKVTLTPAANTRSRKNPDTGLQFQSPVHNFIFFSEVN